MVYLGYHNLASSAVLPVYGNSGHSSTLLWGQNGINNNEGMFNKPYILDNMSITLLSQILSVIYFFSLIEPFFWYEHS